MPRNKKRSSLTSEEVRAQLRAVIEPWLEYFLCLKACDGILTRLNTLLKADLPYPDLTNQLCMLDSYAHSLLDKVSGSQEFYKDAIKQMRRILKRSGESRINQLKIFSKIFLDEYRKKTTLRIPQQSEDWLTDVEIDNTVNCAIATYLESWLISDRSTFLTIEEFSKYGYQEKEKASQDDYTWESRKASFHRAYQKYDKLYSLQQEVQKEREEKSAPKAYKVDNQRKLCLPVLAWCEAIAHDKLDILDILFFKKHLMNRKSAHDSNQNDRLCQALELYKSLVNNIISSYPDDGSGDDAYKAFVAQCIMLQMIERSYRFVLAGQIAKYALDNDYDPGEYNKELFSVHFGETQDDNLLLMSQENQLDENRERAYVKTHYSLKTLGYEEIVKTLFGSPNTKEVEVLIQKELLRREACSSLLTGLYLVCPFGRQTWKSADFKEAAAFFMDQYPILKEFADLNAPEIRNHTKSADEAEKKAHKYYDYYHSYYVTLLRDTITQTERIISHMTNMQ